MKKIEGELIDTLWNVNMFGNKRHISTLRGINRYIMECKFHGKLAISKRIIGINRYIMECKLAS